MSNSIAHIYDLFDCSQGYIPYRLSDLMKNYGSEEGKRIKEERLWHSKEKHQSILFRKYMARIFPNMDIELQEII